MPHREDAAPVIVQGPGWLGLADARLYEPYHQAFADAGFATLVFDYRGFGASDGVPSIDPRRHVEDWRNAIAYARSRADLDRDSIGVFGSGGTGGGNAVMVAAFEEEVRATVAQVPIGDGADWLRRMRTPAAWEAFLRDLDADRTERTQNGHGRLAAPRGDLQIETEGRSQTQVKADVDRRVPQEVALYEAYALLEYRPIDIAGRARNIMVVAVGNDDVTPTDHADAIYNAAPAPKLLVVQLQTTHYAAYEQYRSQITPLMCAWFRRFVYDETDGLSAIAASLDASHFDLRTAE
jgi:cephalosporin-C deacetylase-like acetyl esterase